MASASASASAAAAAVKNDGLKVIVMTSGMDGRDELFGDGFLICVVVFLPPRPRQPPGNPGGARVVPRARSSSFPIARAISTTNKVSFRSQTLPIDRFPIALER